MARVHNFSAGPAALPTSVLAEIADEMMDYRGCGMSVLEMSHRSSMYQQIIDDAEATLRRLLSIPDNYHVLFLQGGATLQFAGIPTFAPEHFARVTQVDTMKRKQFVKGMEQIAQEGAIQIFRDLGAGMEEVIVGVVGTLQFDVFEYRMKNEYGVDLRMSGLPYEHLRLIRECPCDVKDLMLCSGSRVLEDFKGRKLIAFGGEWSVGFLTKHNEGLILDDWLSV